MRIVVTGAGGILGRQIKERWSKSVDLVALGRDQLDVTDRIAVRKSIAELSPDVVVHGAAMTAVDVCETEVDQAFRVNWVGTQNVAEAAASCGAHLAYVSTDYVFDGTKAGEYLEHDPTCPLSVYGKSKEWGERAVREICSRFSILRTQWIYGPGGPNFVDTMIRLSGQDKPLKVVSDQRGCPTYAGHLADGILAVLQGNPGPGTYHLSSRGAATWYDFAVEIFRRLGRKVTVQPCTTEEFPRPAPRPANGVLRNYHLELSIGDPMPAWEQGLEEYLERHHTA